MKIRSRFLIVLAFVSSIAALSQEKRLRMKEFVGNENHHWFRLFVSTKPFDSSKHDLSQLSANMIDGEASFLFNKTVPEEEFDKFELSIDGDSIAIPESLYAWLYNPTLEFEPHQIAMNAFWGHDYESVFVVMDGGDGDGAYAVIWHLRKDGRHVYSLVPGYYLWFQFNNE